MRTGSGSRACLAAGGRARRGVAGAGARDASRRPRAAVVEVPLLFEAGLEGIYDATIAVVADEPLRASGPRHAVTRWSTSAPRASSPRQEKAARATYVVHNDGTEEDLRRELSAVLDKLGE